MGVTTPAQLATNSIKSQFESLDLDALMDVDREQVKSCLLGYQVFFSACVPFRLHQSPLIRDSSIARDSFLTVS